MPDIPLNPASLDQSTSTDGNPGLSDLQLSRDIDGQLVLIAPEHPQPVPVEPFRCFPFTHPDQWISLRRKNGREVVCIPDPQVLGPAARLLLEQELDACEFIPVLQRILTVTTYSAPSKWLVETNRGPTTIVIDHDDDVRQVGPRTVVVVDEHGVRYQVPDRTRLDPHSLKLLQRFL